ncbi:hypothetical protein [Modestobacter sp. NPDC049651]|uniref:hypothetical protein n=1 Tax=unclassified Modestobacter TaxID=2643866 RepID=UPI0033F992E9
MSSYRANLTLPFPHAERAVATLRTELHRQVVADGPAERPDWSTLQLSGPIETFDKAGGICFEYSAAVRRLGSRALVRA